ncbi:DsrE family protein [Promethearchaeum syntrophicum]|uniref:DsrE family protein n=1 Tax=Promethearchaeum syntrophicum TaxID=2594042 RepID=A0A5B9DFQ6_9ARCH|nr:DsrE family protein [Candidatus Prometheoarchaeum syntrophicum]QEE18118.1 sulfur relay protein TusC [Candidatus Prometheoarchaeum syntrophicum]
MTEEKNVVILLRQPPHGTLYPVEGLRMAVAVSADFDPITIAINDAVYTFTKDVDKTMYLVHMNFLKSIDLDIFVDKKSIDERGLVKEDLVDHVKIVDHCDIVKMIAESSVTIPF